MKVTIIPLVNFSIQVVYLVNICDCVREVVSSSPCVQNQINMAQNSNRKGRGNRTVSDSFKNLSAESMKNEAELLGVASSKTSRENKVRAEKILQNFTTKVGSTEPGSVTPQTSVLLLNLLSQYCKTGLPDALADDTMGGIIQGLRTVFEENGHRGPWRADSITGVCSGNPLTANDDVKQLRATHRVHLSQIDRIKMRPRPLPMSLVCEHAIRYWFGCGQAIDYRDVILHAIILLGLNAGLRYDEVAKLRASHVTVNSGDIGTGSIILTITEAIKNSTVGRQYKIRKWPGNTEMRSCMITCPFTALLSWMCIRGNREGYLFCAVNKKNMIMTDHPWPVKEFTSFLRSRLRMCGVGAGDVHMYSGHSLKRGCVQLYRSLGIRDEQIMEIVQMTGPQAYANYCAAYNDCRPSDLPRFTNIGAMVKHVGTVTAEEKE